MVILKQFKKKNKSIQIFPFVMKDDYLIVVLTMMVTLSLKVWLELAFCKKTTDKMIFLILTIIYVSFIVQHIDTYQCEVVYE